MCTYKLYRYTRIDFIVTLCVYTRFMSFFGKTETNQKFLRHKTFAISSQLDTNYHKNVRFFVFFRKQAPSEISVIQNLCKIPSQSPQNHTFFSYTLKEITALGVVRYIEMRSTDHLWIWSVCFSVLIKWLNQGNNWVQILPLCQGRGQEPLQT